MPPEVQAPLPAVPLSLSVVDVSTVTLNVPFAFVFPPTPEQVIVSVLNTPCAAEKVRTIGVAFDAPVTVFDVVVSRHLVFTSDCHVVSAEPPTRGRG